MSKKDQTSTNGEEKKSSLAKTEQYRNWFLLLGVASGIAIGLAASSILINQDSEKNYLENRQEVVVRQDALENALLEKEKTISEIQKNNAFRDKEFNSLKNTLDQGLREERAYVDEKRLRIWREIDRLNKIIKEQEADISLLKEEEESNQATD